MAISFFNKITVISLKAKATATIKINNRPCLKRTNLLITCHVVHMKMCWRAYIYSNFLDSLKVEVAQFSNNLAFVRFVLVDELVTAQNEVEHAMLHSV